MAYTIAKFRFRFVYFELPKTCSLQRGVLYLECPFTITVAPRIFVQFYGILIEAHRFSRLTEISLGRGEKSTRDEFYNLQLLIPDYEYSYPTSHSDTSGQETPRVTETLLHSVDTLVY